MPDRFSDFYLLILGAYGGAPEIRRWMRAQEPDPPQGWPERIRKGGPMITLWVLLYMGAVTWRLADPSRPLPPELKTITMGVIGLFFGTYALRQIRQRTRRGKTGEPEASGPEEDVALQAEILAFLKSRGPSSPGTLEQSLTIPRRSLNRLLRGMVGQRQVIREARSPTDRAAVYRLPTGPAGLPG